MPRYRFPGKMPVPEELCRVKPWTRPVIIKPCPPPPYIEKKICNSKIYDRAIIRKPCDINCKLCVPFIIETFSNLILLPTNLHNFCGYDFSEGELVAVEAEVTPSNLNCRYACTDAECSTTEQPCTTNCSNVCDNICDNNCDDVTVCGYDFTTTESPMSNMIPVKIFNIKRIWKKLIRTVTGSVSREVDKNGIIYYMLTEVYTKDADVPFNLRFKNSLNYQPYTIQYEIVNLMNICAENVGATLESLVGSTISAIYVDYGVETPERDGIPIVIANYEII